MFSPAFYSIADFVVDIARRARLLSRRTALRYGCCRFGARARYHAAPATRYARCCHAFITPARERCRVRAICTPPAAHYAKALPLRRHADYYFDFRFRYFSLHAVSYCRQLFSLAPFRCCLICLLLPAARCCRYAMRRCCFLPIIAAALRHFAAFADAASAMPCCHFRCAAIR